MVELQEQINNVSFAFLIQSMNVLFPVINSTDGYLLWLISGFVASLAFGTAIALLSEKGFKKTGKRSVLLWELK